MTHSSHQVHTVVVSIQFAVADSVELGSEKPSHHFSPELNTFDCLSDWLRLDWPFPNVGSPSSEIPEFDVSENPCDLNVPEEEYKAEDENGQMKEAGQHIKESFKSIKRNFWIFWRPRDGQILETDAYMCLSARVESWKTVYRDGRQLGPTIRY